MNELQTIVERQEKALAALEKRLAETEARTSGDARGPAVNTIAKSSDNASTTPVKASVEQNKASATAPAKGEEKAGPQPVAGHDGARAFLRSTDGNFETRITGNGQFDFRAYQRGNTPPNSFAIKRARIIVEGKLAKYFDYRVETELTDSNSILLRDLYLRVNKYPGAQLTFGHFKEPFTTEELRSDLAQDFSERSMMNNLSPARSPGLMLSGLVFGGILEYQAGAFNGKGNIAANNNDTPEGVIKIRLNPWKKSGSSWAKNLLFGGGYAQGRSLGGSSISGLSESRSYTFFSADSVNGKITRASGDATWLIGPAAFRAEYSQTNQARDGLGSKGTNLPGVVAKGMMGQFTYLLTGETKPDAANPSTKTNLFGGEKGTKGFGAWELKFRYSNLQVADGTTKSNRSDAYLFGFNWYLNRFVKYVQDIGIERFKDSQRVPITGQHSSFVVMSRIQFVY